MKRHPINLATILYYTFIIICVVSSISSFLFQTKYLVITASASIGIAVIKIINQKG